MTDDRRQMTEDRCQRFEFGNRNAAFDELRRDKVGKGQSGIEQGAWRKDRRQMTDVREQISEVGLIIMDRIHSFDIRHSTIEKL